jgi:hypothetical protein
MLACRILGGTGGAEIDEVGPGGQDGDAEASARTADAAGDQAARGRLRAVRRRARHPPLRQPALLRSRGTARGHARRDRHPGARRPERARARRRERQRGHHPPGADPDHPRGQEPQQPRDAAGRVPAQAYLDAGPEDGDLARRLLEGRRGAARSQRARGHGADERVPQAAQRHHVGRDSAPGRRRSRSRSRRRARRSTSCVAGSTSWRRTPPTRAADRALTRAAPPSRRCAARARRASAGWW